MNKWIYIRDDDDDGHVSPQAPEPVDITGRLPLDVAVDGNTVPVFCNGELVGRGTISNVDGEVEFTGTVSGDLARVVQVGSSLSISYYQTKEGLAATAVNLIQEPSGEAPSWKLPDRRYDGGTLDLGIWRDPSVPGVNKFDLFIEQFDENEMWLAARVEPDELD